tara:strand:- start:742 stop:1059 length:318 start_codon:yes stop_codon:yes gene_type:complete
MDYDSYLARQVDKHTSGGDEGEALQDYVDSNYEEIVEDIYYDGEYYFKIDWDNYVYENHEDGGWSNYMDIIEDDFEELVTGLTTELARLKALVKKLKDEAKNEKV